ncbi:MAG: hypothetical protein JRI68_06860 [Deltaproteobacteria bacterium]|nr:hypothetical protein [Deltaproteobacteria bacterium]
MHDGGSRWAFGAALVALVVGCDLGGGDTSTGPAPVAASIPKAPPNARGVDYSPPPPGRPGVATPPTPQSPPTPGPNAPPPEEVESPFGHPPSPPPEPIDAGGGTQL